MPYRTVSPVWKCTEKELESALRKWSSTIDEIIPSTGCEVFFRADDIGYPGKQFSEMISTFKKHSTPLALAIVPVWLNEDRTSRLSTELKDCCNLWTMHLHGYKHMNTETTGKKFEFGPSTSKGSAFLKLKKGRDKLQSMLGKNFVPIFTPPWNRCSLATMQSLVELGFKTISRSKNVKPETPEGLTDIPVNIDLHTRKENSPSESLEQLLLEMTDSIKSGRAGFMLHHQRMNNRAFFFLDILLERLQKSKKIKIKSLELLQG